MFAQDTLPEMIHCFKALPRSKVEKSLLETT